MFRFIRNFTYYIFLIAVSFTFSILTNAQTNRPQDVVGLEKTIRFRRGANSATFSGQIKLGTTHWFHVRAREGQEMAVVLKTGNKTSFTIYGQQSGILEGADGVRRTLVELPESGDFLIEIGTDATANYTLEVTIH